MRFRLPWYRTGTPDPEAFFAELASAHPGKGNYSNMDKYRDFRQLFLGSEQGKRVLHEILSWGHMFRPVAPRAGFDPNKTMFHDGERNIALQIMTVMNAEPKERPKSSKET